MTDHGNWLAHYTIGSTELDGPDLTCDRCHAEWNRLDGHTLPQLIDLATDHEIHRHGLLDHIDIERASKEPATPTAEELKRNGGATPNQTAVSLMLLEHGINPYEIPSQDDAINHSGYLRATGHITIGHQMQAVRIPWQLDTTTVQQIVDAWATCIHQDE